MKLTIVEKNFLSWTAMHIDFMCKNRTRPYGLSFFRHCETFFSKYFCLQRVPPSSFFDILQQIEVSKSPKGLPFQVFRHYETGSKFSFFDFSFFFSKNPKGPPFTISKSLSFLSLRYGADFRRSRLVTVL